MYEILQHLHSLTAYAVILFLVFSTVDAWTSKKRKVGEIDEKIFLYALIATHAQLLLGFSIYFMSPFYKAAKEMAFIDLLRDGTMRLYVIEHPIVMIASAVLITMGFSKQKRMQSSKDRFKTVSIYFTIALVLILTRLPWAAWMPSYS